MRRLSCWTLIILAVLTAATRPTASQPLIERVPADALLYLGWAGTDGLAAKYEPSTLRQVVELTDPQRVALAWHRAMPMLRHTIDDPRFDEHYQHLNAIMAASTRGATAVYLTPGPMTVDGRIAPPGVALLWQPATAADREALLAGLTFYLQQLPDFPIELSLDGPGIQLRINGPTPGPTAVGGRSDTAGLRNSPTFSAGLPVIDADRALVGYLDLPAVSAWLVQLLESEMVDEQDRQTLHAVVATLHPAGLGPMFYTAGFEGHRWQTHTFLAAAAPRAGLASLLDTPALSADTLNLPPADATWVGHLSLDPGRLMDLVRQVATAVGPEAADALEEGLATASGLVGIDVEQQLVRGLGTSWTFYADPQTGGDTPAGVVLVNPLRDAEGVDRGLRAIQMFGNLALLQGLRETPVKLQVHTQAYDGLDVHSLMLPLLAPSWAVIDGRLVVGLYPQTILGYRDRGDRPGSVMDHPDLVELREVIGTRRLTGLSWVDLPTTVDQSYGRMIATEHLLTGLTAMATGQPMPAVLPPLGRLRPLLEPAGSYGWVDDRGWHSVSRSPFPGSTLLAPQTSVMSLLQTHHLFAIVPLLAGFDD
jgi:hypothetical protein